ncbi:hypothetical protein LX36DRAFT_362591 [Colletotrichum falcatum]|nr:hypothetical protein LX36DRAFT_362591 [Colletotrichum falcatum]
MPCAPVWFLVFFLVSQHFFALRSITGQPGMPVRHPGRGRYGTVDAVCTLHISVHHGQQPCCARKGCPIKQETRRSWSIPTAHLCSLAITHPSPVVFIKRRTHHTVLHVYSVLLQTDIHHRPCDRRESLHVARLPPPWSE